MTTASQIQAGASRSCVMSTSMASASSPARRPNSRETEMATSSTRKRSSSVQRLIQLVWTWSAPEACSSRQPGGRFKVAEAAWKSWSQPTAGMLAPRPLQAALGLHRDRPLADLDAAAVAAGQAGDELVLAGHGDAAEQRPGPHLQPPAAPEPPADRVARGVAAAVEVQPELPGERELVGGRVGVAAPALLEGHGGARLHEVGGERPPAVGQRRLARVDRGDARDRRHPQRGARLPDPDLVLLGPDPLGRRADDRLAGGSWRASRVTAKVPGRTCTRSRPPASSRAGRGLSRAWGTKPAGSARAQQHLAHLARHRELQPGGQDAGARRR